MGPASHKCPLMATRPELCRVEKNIFIIRD